MPEFIVEQTLILKTEDQAKAAERAQQIATFLAHDWPELTNVHTGAVEPCPPPEYDPWWGDLCVAEMEAERQARKQDRIEAEAFQARIDAACCGDPDDCTEACR